MTFDSINPTLKLKARQIVRVADLRGARIACRQGTVWITQDGDVADTVLEPGQGFETAKPGRILIYGLGAAEVEIVEAARAAVPKVAAPRAVWGAPRLALAA